VAAAVATLLAFGKVFSPQYMIWLVPFVVLVAGRRGIAAGMLTAAALGLTHLWFPHHYEVLASFYAKPSFEVLLRNLTVVALAAVLVWPRSEERSSGRAAPASRRE
jgi:thiamine transporter ThiT